MKQVVLNTLASAINAFLALDSQAAGQAEIMAQLAHKTIAFHIKHPKLVVLFHFNATKVEILSMPKQIINSASFKNKNKNKDTEQDIHIDAHIYTSLFQLMRLKLKKKPSLVNNEFYIEGDIELVKQLNRLFEQHDIDWEEHLSKFIGDVLAHKTGNLFKRNKRYVNRLQSNITDNIGEYLQEEAELLIPPLALEDFMEQLTDLVLQKDRIQARLIQIADHIDDQVDNKAINKQDDAS